MDKQNRSIQTDSFQRWAAIAAIASAVLAVGSIVAPLPAIDFDVSSYADPISVFRRGGQAVAPLKMSLLLDMVGYYLLIAPLVMVLGAWLKPRSGQWSRLFVGTLLTYVLLGAVGAAVLTGASPRLMQAFDTAGPEQRIAIEGLYSLLWDSIYGGLWNILEVLLAGVGWFGLGLLLRPQRRFAGWVTIVLGLSCLLDATGNIFGLKVAADLGLYVYLVLAPLWALGMGIALLRRPVTIVPAG